MPWSIRKCHYCCSTGINNFNSQLIAVLLLHWFVLAFVPNLSHLSFLYDSLLHSFKLWVFTWMSIGGVETEGEFQQSLVDLRHWLGTWRQHEGHHKKNVAILEEFLTKKLLNCRERWFFPNRQGKLTFDLKTTSPLESLNRALKYTSGCKVQPNMSLLKSLQMQDTQASLRNRERHVQCCGRARGRSTSIRSWTANDVSPCAESIICQQCNQSNRYAC